MSNEAQAILLGIGLVGAGIYFLFKSKNDFAQERLEQLMKGTKSFFGFRYYYSKKWFRTQFFFGGIFFLLVGMMFLTSQIPFTEAVKTPIFFFFLFALFANFLAFLVYSLLFRK